MKTRIYQPGDILKARVKSLPIIFHYGIIIRQDNQLSVVHNTASKRNNYGGNILVEPINIWLNSRELESIEHTNIKRIKIIEAINKYKSQKFNLFTFNCEHFIFELKHGRPHSPQLTKWIYHLISLMMLVYAIRKKLH